MEPPLKHVYIRVKDRDTKHEFDVLSTDPRIAGGLFIPVNKPHYPPSSMPRRAKYRKPLGSRGY